MCRWFPSYRFPQAKFHKTACIVSGGTGTNHVATDQRTQADIIADLKTCIERDPATKQLLAGLVTEMAIQTPNQLVNENTPLPRHHFGTFESGCALID